MATITFFHAHPDDEAIATAGTMARLSDQGHRVVLVTATGGELGEIPEGLLRPGESLAERRADELAESCRVLGVARQTFLGYHDSGMAGEPTNLDPSCFAAADIDEAVSKLSAILIDEASDVLVIYDEHGGYGHPDHVQVHRVGMAAGEQAGTGVIYMATMDRDFMSSLPTRIETSEWNPPEGAPDDLDTMGEPESRITTTVDVRPWIDRKHDAMRAHPSQISETSFFLSMPDDVFVVVWGQEWYIRVRPEVDDSRGSPKESELLLDAGTAAIAPESRVSGSAVQA